MDFIVNDVLSGELVPILLGISPETSETAHRMFRKYGIVSHVFCDKIPFALHFSLCMKFHVVPHTEGEQLMLRALSDFADQLENADLILYLTPCTEAYANLTWLHREQLERRFVLADKQEMLRVWFGESNSRSKEGKK
ncbi:MAG: hypothetical protein IKJ35_05780 [Clostridia bacterium]|nr:hypothetical protein [Clostridia bacterium]